MAISEVFKSFFNRAVGVTGVNVDINEERLPVATEWFFNARLGQPRNINLSEVRTFAACPWVQMVHTTIKKELYTIEYDFVNKDEEDETYYEKEIKIVQDFFNNLNSNREHFKDITLPTISDVLEIDAGAWIKVFTADSYEIVNVDVLDSLGRPTGKTEPRIQLKPFGKRQLAQLVYVDGGTLLKEIDLHKRLLAYYQYSFKNPRTNPIRFEPDEVVYFSMNPRAYTNYGYSPVQSIQQVLELLINSTKWNKDYFKNNAVPDGIVGLPNANIESLQKFKELWELSIKGKGHKLLYHNTDAKFTPLSFNNRDMEYLEGQKWFMHLVFGIHGLSPIEAGFHENVNQGNQAGQERVTVRNAIKPYLEMYENAINNFIIPELLQRNPNDIKFKFKYKPRDHSQEQIEFEQAMKEIEAGTMTINEFRKMKGRKIVEWGDEPKSIQDQKFQAEQSKELLQNRPDKNNKGFKEFLEKKYGVKNV